MSTWHHVTNQHITVPDCVGPLAVVEHKLRALPGRDEVPVIWWWDSIRVIVQVGMTKNIKLRTCPAPVSGESLHERLVRGPGTHCRLVEESQQAWLFGRGPMMRPHCSTQH